MIRERFIQEIAKEIERIQAERQFVEIEYTNYIKEIECMHKATKTFSCIEKSKRHYPYDMDVLKEKHKVAKGIGTRF